MNLIWNIGNAHLYGNGEPSEQNHWKLHEMNQIQIMTELLINIKVHLYIVFL